ncbi:MAG: ATP-binding protein [Bacteroidota bacterium]
MISKHQFFLLRAVCFLFTFSIQSIGQALSQNVDTIEADGAIPRLKTNEVLSAYPIDRLKTRFDQLYRTSELFQRQGFTDSAIYYAQKATLTARQAGMEETLYFAMKRLVDIYEDRGEYRKALDLQKELLVSPQEFIKLKSEVSLEDTVANSDLKKNLSSKEQEFIALQASAKSRTILLLAIVTVLLILFIAFAYRQYVRDVYQLKKIQSQNKLIRRRNKEIALRIDELRQFAYIASHDLQTPLSGIVKIVDWFNRDYGNVLDSQGIELLDLMRSRAKRMESMLHGILAYFKIGTKAQENELIDLKELVMEVLKSINYENKLKLKLDVRNIKLWTDRSQLKQVMYNLIHNSIHHNDKPIVSIQIGFEKKDNEWCLVVRDNGPGIEQRLLKKVFDIFQQASKEDENRSGIGLAIVKRILAGWDSKISIESKPGLGSTVYLHLNKKLISRVKSPQRELVYS